MHPGILHSDLDRPGALRFGSRVLLRKHAGGLPGRTGRVSPLVR